MAPPTLKMSSTVVAAGQGGVAIDLREREAFSSEDAAFWRPGLGGVDVFLFNGDWHWCDRFGF